MFVPIGPLSSIRIPPRRLGSRCGASVVTARNAVATERDSNVAEQNPEKAQACARRKRFKEAIESPRKFAPVRAAAGPSRTPYSPCLDSLQVQRLRR